MVKAILFDLWGTLVETGVYPSPLRQVKSILRIRMPFPVFVRRFEQAFMTRPFDSNMEGFKEAAKALEVSPPPFVFDKLVGLWNKYMILAKPYEETFEVLESLRKQFKLALISNSDAINSKQVMEKLELAKYFDNVFLSWEVGLLKGEPEFYEKVLSTMKLNKEDVVVVGDSVESDMEGAEMAGLKGILVDRRDRREFEPKVRNLRELESKIREVC
ncbi:HAD family hydrolase [Candidatus Woesearchaeota archaeon]|nr:MAG: HAD family hydrolase [Candidatus Woesearchaeota archaeon]